MFVMACPALLSDTGRVVGATRPPVEAVR